MKKLVLLFASILLVVSCKKEAQQTSKSATKKIAAVSSEMMETAIIYEANIRQYSKEGSFSAFTKDIPQLKELGVKIIWMMPIFPISETKRKATGGDFASLIKDPEERKKALGSYYAVSDFQKVNPEFGTIEDFRDLVKTAHANGIYVILDWVPNHTGWDHTWIQTNPEFYTKNAKGEVTHPLKEDGTSVGWDDVADLNYDNAGLRDAMTNDMLHWITNEEVDGFRCDVAGSVPTDFWQEAIPKLRKEKALFMLAEAWEPALLKGDLFDMAYGWDTHHKMNAIAQGKETVADWDQRMEDIAKMYEKDDIIMNFVTNHDENSWNGSLKERMGAAAEVFTALSYVAPGMPLIYSGQEYDLVHRLKFFEKDEIPKTKGKTWALLEKLGSLKSKKLALHGGKKAASYTKVATNNKNVLLFTREKEGKSITFLANLSKESQTIKNSLKGDYVDLIKGAAIRLQEETITLEAWEYLILE